jgi:hypothetical protein
MSGSHETPEGWVDCHFEHGCVMEMWLEGEVEVEKAGWSSRDRLR